MGLPIRNWDCSLPNWPAPFFLSLPCTTSSSSSFVFSFFFLTTNNRCPLPLKPFLMSDLCTCWLKSSRRHTLADAGGDESEREAVAGSGAKWPLGGPRLFGEIPSDSTVGSPWFYFHEIARKLSFPFIPRSTIEMCRNISHFLCNLKLWSLI